MNESQKGGLIFAVDESRLSDDERAALVRLRARSEDFPHRVCICDNVKDGERYISEGTPVIGYETGGCRLPFHYLLTSFDGADEVYIEHVYKRFFDIPYVMLKTKRCIVREICMEDMDALFTLYSYPGMTDHVEPLFERAEEEDYEKKYISNVYDLVDYGMWVVCDRETGELIGRAGLEDKGRYEEYGLALGYMIRTDYQRRGLATEVCKSILGYAMTRGEMRFYCEIDEGHTPSIGLAESLGFIHTDTGIWTLSVGHV